LNEELREHRPDRVGPGVGLLTFLSGIALIALTFRLAFQLFSVPAEEAIGIRQGATVDLYQAGQSLAWVFGRVLLLLVMCLAGSLISGRGIRLYVASRAPAPNERKSKPQVREAIGETREA
jgi:hypothetical protein